MDIREPQIVKKVYFIRGTEKVARSEKLIQAMKNKFKAMDAIRDLLDWHREGRDFSVSLSPNLCRHDKIPEVRIRVDPQTENSRNHEALIHLIGQISNWLQRGFGFDIGIVPTESASPDLS